MVANGIYYYIPIFLPLEKKRRVNRNANKVLMFVINFRFCFHLPHVQPLNSPYLNHKSEHIKYNWSYSQAGGKIIKRLLVLATKLNSDGSTEIPNNLKTKYWAKNGEKRIANCDVKTKPQIKENHLNHT